MKNVRQRLHRLEQLPQFQCSSSPLDLFGGREIESLSMPELEVLWFLLSIRNEDAGELSEDETAACAAWHDSVEAEVRRMGFASFAEAEPVSRATSVMSNLLARLEKIDRSRADVSGAVTFSTIRFDFWQRILARWAEKENLTFPDLITREVIEHLLERGDGEDEPLR